MEFAPRMSRFKASPSQIASARVRDLIAEGRDIVKLTAGEPDFPTPDHAKAAATACMDANEIKYTPINGLIEMRKAAQLKFKRDNGLEYELDQIAVGAGAKQVLFNALMSTVSQGDETIIPGPYWAAHQSLLIAAKTANSRCGLKISTPRSRRTPNGLCFACRAIRQVLSIRRRRCAGWPTC